jgi:hypothetical protein
METEKLEKGDDRKEERKPHSRTGNPVTLLPDIFRSKKTQY